MDTGSSSIANALLKLNFSLLPRRVTVAPTGKGGAGRRDVVSSNCFLPHFCRAFVLVSSDDALSAIRIRVHWFYRSSLLLLPSLYLFVAFSSPTILLLLSIFSLPLFLFVCRQCRGWRARLYQNFIGLPRPLSLNWMLIIEPRLQPCLFSLFSSHSFSSFLSTPVYKYDTQPTPSSTRCTCRNYFSHLSLYQHHRVPPYFYLLPSYLLGLSVFRHLFTLDFHRFFLLLSLSAFVFFFLSPFFSPLFRSPLFVPFSIPFSPFSAIAFNIWEG